MQSYLAKYFKKYLSSAAFKFLKILTFLTICLMDTEYWQFAFSKLLQNIFLCVWRLKFALLNKGTLTPKIVLEN